MTKRILRIFVTMCLIVVLGSCEDFIDKLPEDTLSPVATLIIQKNCLQVFLAVIRFCKQYTSTTEC